MDWINFKGAVQFGKPADWDDKTMGPCGALPVKRGMHAGARTYSSYWRPTEADLAVLLAGGVIEVQLFGMQPAMSMIVLDGVQDEIRT